MSGKLIPGLRFKIILASFAISSIVSITLAVAAYRILEEKLFSELKDRVGNITRVGSLIIDRGRLKDLAERIDEELTEDEIDEIENSEDYRVISQRLNLIRDTQKNLIRYVYIVAATKDPNITKYLVDADVIALKAEGSPDEEISHFNSDLETVDFPVLQEAIASKKPLVENEYTYDEAFKVNSVSGYAPILDADGERLIGLLGVDMADIEVRAALEDVTQKSLWIAALALVLSLTTSILMGTYFTRGIIYLDNVVRSFSEKQFSVRSEIHSSDEVGRLSLSFNHMAQTIQEYSSRLEALLRAYGRFVPHDLLQLLDKKSITDVSLGDQTQREMSVLFADIRAFTAMSEKMSPKENFDFLNAYLRRVGPEIRSHQGIIDKYIGDAVMALFPIRAEDAVNAGIAMMRRLREYNRERVKSGYAEIRIGIGIHMGRVMLGTIGEEERMDGTVISDTVNISSRLEGLTKLYGASIIVSDGIQQKLQDTNRYFFRYLGRVRVRGKSETVSIYEVCDGDDEMIMKRKREAIGDYRHALDLFYSRRFAEAHAILEDITHKNPADHPARLYMHRSEHYIRHPVAENWDGVEDLLTK
jgi:class 3 adenylate cyclase